MGHTGLYRNIEACLEISELYGKAYGHPGFYRDTKGNLGAYCVVS